MMSMTARDSARADLAGQPAPMQPAPVWGPGAQPMTPPMMGGGSGFLEHQSSHLFIHAIDTIRLWMTA